MRFLITRYAMVAELDCDERVRSVLALDRQGQAQYAELLLAGQSNRRILLPGHTLGSSARTLKFRIQEVFMQHSKRQRLTRLFLFGTLFAAGTLFLPELRAGSLREPVPEFVAEHLPADAKTLLFFRGSGLDAEGIKLLDAAQQFVAPLGESYLSLLSLMKTTAGTGGFFYQVFTSGKQEYILLKNGGDSNQMLLGPSQWYQEKIHSGAGKRFLPALHGQQEKNGEEMGLPRDLREKAAAGPNDIVRAVRIDSPGNFGCSSRAGSTGSPSRSLRSWQKISPRNFSSKKPLPGCRKRKKADAIEFLRKTVQFTSRDLAGRKISFVEFPLSRQSISLWIEFFRRLRDEKMAAAIPHVIALEPANGAQDVDPNLSEIKVTFDRPMSPNSWSFCQRGPTIFRISSPSLRSMRTGPSSPCRSACVRVELLYLPQLPAIPRIPVGAGRHSSRGSEELLDRETPGIRRGKWFRNDRNRSQKYKKTIGFWHGFSAHPWYRMGNTENGGRNIRWAMERK
ncbi:MAG: Ig-like domain-containing protein [Lentisphaeria bacterium]|nr:MAG: Ig-like domain-containing protein [Lentisphaeria bacterium]